MPVADPDIGRLIKLCGLLGSAQVGERAAAALKVTEFLQAHQLTWEDVLAQDEPGAVSVTVGDAPMFSAIQLQEAREKGYGDGYSEGMKAGHALAKADNRAIHSSGAAATIAEQKAYAKGFADGAQASRPGPQPVGQNAYGSGAFSTGRTWQEAVGDAWMHVDRIRASRPREADFLDSLVARIARGQPSLSPKQELWLRDICLRLGVEQW